MVVAHMYTTYTFEYNIQLLLQGVARSSITIEAFELEVPDPLHRTFYTTSVTVTVEKWLV